MSHFETTQRLSWGFMISSNYIFRKQFAQEKGVRQSWAAPWRWPWVSPGYERLGAGSEGREVPGSVGADSAVGDRTEVSIRHFRVVGASLLG